MVIPEVKTKNYGFVMIIIQAKNYGLHISKLSRPTAKDGIYMAHENCPDTFSRFNSDHPSMLGALGILPGEGIDCKTMLNTLHAVLYR